MAECVIKIEHLQKKYKNAMPLNDLCVEINRGDIAAVIGPSGTGKSTLIRCINYLETPTAGKITVLGTETTARNAHIDLVRQKMGMVFQNFNLFNHLTVLENIIAAPMSLKKVPEKEAKKKALQLLAMVGLEDKTDRFPSELSGGQKQRVAIARALAMEPEILLLDEPTSALDPTMVKEVEMVIEKLAEQNLTMIIVTHELNLVKRVSNRVLFLNEGIVYEDGTPQQIFENPQREKTRYFIDQQRYLKVSVTPSSVDLDQAFFRIRHYVQDNGLSDSIGFGLKIILDELVAGIIAKKLKSEEKILFTVFTEKNKIDVQIKYSGMQYNPFNDTDEITRMLLQHFGDFTYTYDDGINIISTSMSM